MLQMQIDSLFLLLLLISCNNPPITDQFYTTSVNHCSQSQIQSISLLIHLDQSNAQFNEVIISANQRAAVGNRFQQIFRSTLKQDKCSVSAVFGNKISQNKQNSALNQEFLMSNTTRLNLPIRM